ncbi:MAG: response regulator transcription factor [Bacteroides sp.]|nr:response regulator transcription factor [Bacteroides sp.]MCM1094674.1 response regulator transcription factor [Terasakiella sp.]
MQAKILLIDDEEAVCEILKYNLEKEGYEADTAYSAEEALEMDLKQYDLFIVDIMMGDMSGFDFAKRIRNVTATQNTPIIFCSALNEEDEKVMGLNIGADDYVTKPFSIGEVLARVRAVLRRAAAQAQTTYNLAESDYEQDLTFKTLRIDRNEKISYMDGEPLQLTRTEFEILEFFLTHRNRIYSRQEIISNVWGGDVVVTNRTIDTNITRLRKKLGEYSNNIVTRQGFGYGFKETF